MGGIFRRIAAASYESRIIHDSKVEIDINVNCHNCDEYVSFKLKQHDLECPQDLECSSCGFRFSAEVDLTLLKPLN